MRVRLKEGKTRSLVPALKESATVFCLRADPRASTTCSFATPHAVLLARGLARFDSAIAFWSGLLLVLTLSSACGQRKARTEWRPEDHQPPPAEMPEGQGAAEESGDSTARAAKALWSMRCAQCHGEEGHGDGSGRPPAAALPDFASAAFHETRSDAELYQVIEKGRSMMPAFGQEITRAGVDALIGHIRSLREQK